jgi:hypothetical protein
MGVALHGYPHRADHLDDSVENQLPQPAAPTAPTTRDRAPGPPRAAGDSVPEAPRSTPAAAASQRVAGGVRAYGHWLGIGMATLPGGIEEAQRYPDAVTVANVASNGVATFGELTGTLNTSGSRALAGIRHGALGVGATIGLGLTIHQVTRDAQQFARNPQSTDAKWRLANSGLQAGINLGALAATPFFPEASLVPLFVPDVAEVSQAVQLHGTEQALRQSGLTTEAQAVHRRYVDASLNATPVVNWFQAYYRDGTQPAIEKFEASQHNYDGAPPQHELPPAARSDARVVDFYGAAMRERLEQLKNAQRDFLAGLARREGYDSVTLVSHAPQVFTWPASGKPMRVFDRAVALTWSRASGKVTGTFFGAEADGTFRLPVLNEGIACAPGQHNLVVISSQLDSAAQPVKFDLAAYRDLPPGTVLFRDPEGYAMHA